MTLLDHNNKQLATDGKRFILKFIDSKCIIQNGY